MKLYQLILPTIFTLSTSAALAEPCSVNIAGNDAMQFDKKAIEVSKGCKDFTVHLSHPGKLPRNAMGHNWVLSKSADARAIATDGVAAGLDNNYLKPGDTRILAATKIIGGGEQTSVTFVVSQLNEKESYTFFCSFPGHIALMQGSLAVVP